MIESGIYCIKNIENNHKYIGSSVNINKRLTTHKSSLKANKHCNSYLQNAWNFYGEDKFIFEVLETIENKDLLLIVEQKYLDDLKPEYNILKLTQIKGKTGKEHPHFGRKRSEEFKRGQSIRGRKLSDEQMEIVVNLAERGLTQRQIAKEMNCCNASVNRILNNKIKTFECKLKIDFMKGEKNPAAKLTLEKAKLIRELYSQGNLSMKSLGEIFCISAGTVCLIVNHKIWQSDSHI